MSVPIRKAALKMYMISLSLKTGGVPDNRSVSSFLPKGALTHHPQSGRWYPSFVGLVRSL